MKHWHDKQEREDETVAWRLDGIIKAFSRLLNNGDDSGNVDTGDLKELTGMYERTISIQKKYRKIKQS
jgi:hypothetical protein